MRIHLFLYFLLIFKSEIILAQFPSKLFSSDTLKIFSNGEISVWGDFCNAANNGSGGSLVINSGGKLIMFGDTFQNINATKIGGGGQFEMKRPRPAPYASSSRQIMISGGPTISFPTFIVNTTSTIDLKSYDLRIRDSLKFSTGNILLNKNDLIIGDGSYGIITGYNENNFVVTNGNTLDTNKGYLIREQISATATVFPIGQSTGDYTPASIVNNGTTDNFKVRVFDTVYENGYSTISSIPVSANDRSVQRTWDIREGTKGGSNVNLILQYNTNTEASSFSSNRNKAFISHYTGSFPNNGGDTVSNSKWDMFKLSSTSLPSSPGTLTTGSNLSGAGMKTRNGITSFSPFSITTWAPGAIPLPIPILSFIIKWDHKVNAEIHWEISDANMVSTIVLERSIDGTNFTFLTSFNNLNTTTSFEYSDIDIYNQINNSVFYRLKLIENNGFVNFSNNLMLKKNYNLESNIKLFPIPANETLTVDFMNIDFNLPAIIQMYNAMGQLVFEKTIEVSKLDSFSEFINLTQLNAGIYVLKIDGENIAYQEKFIIERQ